MSIECLYFVFSGTLSWLEYQLLEDNLLHISFVIRVDSLPFFIIAHNLCKMLVLRSHNRTKNPQVSDWDSFLSQPTKPMWKPMGYFTSQLKQGLLFWRSMCFDASFSGVSKVISYFFSFLASDASVSSFTSCQGRCCKNTEWKVGKASGDRWTKEEFQEGTEWKSFLEKRQGLCSFCTWFSYPYFILFLSIFSISSMEKYSKPISSDNNLYKNFHAKLSSIIAEFH